MSHHYTFDLRSSATTVPPPSHQETAPDPIDAPVGARPSKAFAVRRGFLRSSQPSDSTRTGLRKPERRVWAAVLVAAPLVGFAGALLTQDYGGDMSQELEFIAAHNTRWLIANYLTLLMGALMTMAIGILMTLARVRAAVLGYFGGMLAIFGIYFHGAVVGYSLVQAPLVASELPKHGVLGFTDQAMYQDSAFTAILIPFLGFFLGMILLAVALWRARVAPAWVAAIIAAAPLTEFLGIRVASPDLMFALLTIGFGSIAVRRMRSDDGGDGPNALQPR